MVLSACAPKSENTQFTDLAKEQYQYTPRNQDRELSESSLENFSLESVFGLDKSISENQPWIEDSVGVFKLAENAMLMSNTQNGAAKAEYQKFGQNLLKLFYQSKENSTQFGKDETMYLPAALGFEGKRIQKVLSEIATPENIEITNRVLSNNKITWPETKPNLKPAEFIRSIKTYLKNTSNLLAESGVSAGFVNTFSAQVEKDYIVDLNRGEARLADTDQNTPLRTSSVLIREVIESLKFIPRDVVKNLLEDLIKAKEYADLIEPTHSSGAPQVDRQIKVIASIWLDLKPHQREKYIKPANEMLYTKMNDFSDKLIGWLAGRVKLEITDGEFYFGNLVYKRGFESALNTSCHVDVHTDLSQWIRMNEVQKAAFKQDVPELFNVFSRYNANELRTIASEFSGNEFKKPLTGGLLNRFRNDLEPVCIARIRTLLDRSINLYLLSELDEQIRAWGSMIEGIVRDKTMENLESIAHAMKSPKDFESYFARIAHPIMGDMLFNGDTLNGLENSKVQVFVDSKNQLSMKRETGSRFETGAEVLGLSLAAQYRRILSLPEYEQIEPTSKEYYRIVFSQVNKMLSMIGFRTMDNLLVPALHRSFYGNETNDSNYRNFDVYKYECNAEKRDKQAERKSRYEAALRNNETPNPDDYVDIKEDCAGFENYSQNLYLIPDQLEVRGAFDPGSYRKESSIRAQSEVIRGAALMLNYFSDWRGTNGFDVGLGTEKYNEIEVFPKHAFVNLAVALTTAPLRALQKEQTPLKLFNILGQEIKGWSKNGLPDLDSVDPNLSAEERAQKQIIQAAIVDLGKDGPSNTVKAEDMGYFISAIDEFLIATNGIEKTQASVINPQEKTVRENMELILKSRKLLRMLMFAMSNFMISRMQDADGGFWSHYELEHNGSGENLLVRTEPRTLETQLSVIKALLKVYRNWGSESALVAAVEAYYFMNQKLWNPVTSFYKNSEQSNGSVKPYLFLEALINVRSLIPYINNANSQAQAQRMFDSYSKEFLKWNETAKPMRTSLN